MLTRILTLVALLVEIGADTVNPTFILDYFKEKGINQVVTFACWNEKDSHSFCRHMMKQRYRVSYNEIENDLQMTAVLKVNYYKIGVVLDLDCPRSRTIFDEFSAARLPFNDTYNWLVVTADPEVPYDVFRHLLFTVESELTVALTHNTTYTLYDVYNHSYRHGGRLNVTAMGYWNKENGLQNQLTAYKYKRRQDFHGLTLNVSTVLVNKPEPDLETYMTTRIKRHQDPNSRFHYAIMLKLQDMYNFKMNLKLDKSWGYLVNGTFNGIIGDMQKGITDISASGFQFKSERMNFVEHTVEVLIVRIYVYFRHPKKNALRNPFLKPFTQNVWWIALNFAIIIWIVLLVSLKVEKYYKTNKKGISDNNAPSEAALTVIAAVSQQSASDSLHLLSGRITLVTLFIWALLMFQFYSASIVGSLLAPSPKFINNVYDLADSNLHFICEDMPYFPDFFRTSSDPATMYLREKKMKDIPKQKMYVSAQDGLRQVREGGYALFIDSATAYKVIEETFSQDHICELSELVLLPPKPVTIATSKHSPFKKALIYGIRQIVQHGLADHLLKVHLHRKPHCPESFRSQPLPVEIREFSPAIFVVVGGLILATIIMVIEHLSILHKRKHLPEIKEESNMKSEGSENLDPAIQIFD